MREVGTVNTVSEQPTRERGVREHAEGLLSRSRATVPGPQGGARHRSWGLVTLAALLVLGTGLAVAAWGLNAGQKDSVLAVREAVAKGEVIERDNLISKPVSGIGDAVPVDRISTVVGKTATVDLLDGQVVTEQMATSTPVPGAGQATVGLALDPARVPGTGLEPGDVVNVVAVPPGEGGRGSDATALDTPEVLAAGAQVYSVGGDSTAGGQVLVTVVVSAYDAARLAAYSTQNRIAVVETAPLDTPIVKE